MHRWHSPIAWWFSQIVQWHSWRCHSSSRSLQTHKLVCEKTAACLQVVCNSALNNLTRYIDRFFARFLDKVLIRRTQTTVAQLVDFHVRWSFEFLVPLKRKLWNCTSEFFPTHCGVIPQAVQMIPERVKLVYRGMSFLFVIQLYCN